MGTNFYFLTKDKDKLLRWFDYGEYELTDEPEFGYEVHIAKTSCGWLPLFQAHRRIRSVAELKRAYDSKGFMIVDEYGTEYDWDSFDERVLKFNGGRRGVMKPEPYDQTVLPQALRDPKMPRYTPVSHFEYGFGEYANRYFSDADGYEFSEDDFS